MNHPSHPPHYDRPVTRSEFASAFQRVEAVLEQQTVILRTLAVSDEKNQQRDEKIVALTDSVTKLTATVAAMAVEQERAKGIILFIKWLGAALTESVVVFLAKK